MIWHPIEKAPKDGTRILLRTGHNISDGTYIIQKSKTPCANYRGWNWRYFPKEPDQWAEIEE